MLAALSIDLTFSGSTNRLMFQLMCLSMSPVLQGCCPYFNWQCLMCEGPLQEDDLIPYISMLVIKTYAVVSLCNE